MFPADAREDQDLFEQLLNEIRDEEKGLWLPVSDAIPWDFRDAARYARCAAEVKTNGSWQRLVARKTPQQQAEARKKEEKRPHSKSRLDVLGRKGGWARDIRE